MTKFKINKQNLPIYIRGLDGDVFYFNEEFVIEYEMSVHRVKQMNRLIEKELELQNNRGENVIPFRKPRPE
jgi:hypothetical protein